MLEVVSSDLLLGFYGDDFTGSTDAMEGLTRAGLRTVLFISPPQIDQLRKYKGLRALGVAGCGRTLTPERMDAELGRAYVPDSPLDGMEICFKGGQVGKDDYFGSVLDPSEVSL
jgi:uncharacterized protein YgbK (DUF1537 family)